MLLVPWLEGFAITSGLIMAIGAQNAFVLKQGIKRQHLFLTAFTCFVCDSFLVASGVYGLGALIKEQPIFVNVLRYAGALFLIGYGIRSWINVFRPHALMASLENTISQTWVTTFLAVLAFTFLNPHTYIDTVLILGSVGSELPLNQRLSFVLGALTFSLTWFFGLAYGASALSPIFKNPRAWQILDTIMGFVMIGIAIKLIV